MTGNEGREGRVEEETLTLVGKAPGVGDRRERHQTAAQEINV